MISHAFWKHLHFPHVFDYCSEGIMIMQCKVFYANTSPNPSFGGFHKRLGCFGGKVNLIVLMASM